MENTGVSLPLFPLKIMLLPGEQTALHIFEPRYKQLIEEVELKGLTFGIPYKTDDESMTYGAEVSLVSVTNRHPGGECDIVVEAKRMFKIIDYRKKDATKLYPSGSVMILNVFDQWLAGEAVLDELRHLRDAIGPKASVLENEEFNYVPRILLSLDLTHEQKHRFIALENKTKQEQSLLNMLRFSRLIVQQEQRIEDGIFPN